MRKVRFIKSLNVDDVRLAEGRDLEYYCKSPMPMIPIGGDSALVGCDETVDVQVVTVHRFSKITDGSRKDMFIAVSKEVQDLLGIPLDVYKYQLDEIESLLIGTKAALARADNWNEQMQNRVDSANNSTVFQRIKFLIGKIDI